MWVPFVEFKSVMSIPPEAGASEACVLDMEPSEWSTAMDRASGQDPVGTGRYSRTIGSRTRIIKPPTTREQADTEVGLVLRGAAPVSRSSQVCYSVCHGERIHNTRGAKPAVATKEEPKNVTQITAEHPGGLLVPVALRSWTPATSPPGVASAIVIMAVIAAVSSTTASTASKISRQCLVTAHNAMMNPASTSTQTTRRRTDAGVIVVCRFWVLVEQAW